MTNAAVPAGLEFRHSPYGDDHPYDPSPVERLPHDPVAGQPTVLGFEIAPPKAAQAIRVVWRVNDGPERSTPAALERQIDSAAQWKAALPPLAEGDRVTYRFVAWPEEAASPVYEFKVAGWHDAGPVQAWHTGPESLALNCAGGLQIVLSFERQNSVRVRAALAPAERRPEGQPEAFALKEVSDDRLIAANGTLRCVIHRNPYRLEINSSQGDILFAEPAGHGLVWLARDDEVLRLAEHCVAAPGAAFFGFGERFNAFDLRGEAIDALVFEQYKNQGARTYIPVPFFISSRGYGVYVHTSRRTYFDLAATLPDSLSFGVEAPVLDFYVFAGHPKDVVAAFTDLVGKPKLPPKWAFGLWMSGNEWNSQSAVLEQVALTERHGIPAGVMVVEAWSDEATFYIFNDARYAAKPGAESLTLGDFDFPADGRWPDPQGLVEELHRRGVKLVLWQIPVLKTLDAPHAQHEADVGHAVERGFVVHEADHTPYRIRPFWFHGDKVLDFTSPAATQWWQDKRAYLVNELGVDGFKLDGGEHLWGDDLRFSDGRRGAEVNNLFPNLYQAAYAGLAGDERVLFSRSGFTGAQAASCHWAGDENSTFEAFRNSITAGLTAGVSGISFWGWDLAGFSGEIPSAELFLRATAMAAFCPIMQYHSEFNEHRQPSRDRTPWNIADRTGHPEVLTTFRYYANLRMNLLPYIWSEAIKSSRSGLPLMRALPLEYPGDPSVYRFPYQYLFGESLLVAPVARDGQDSLEVYLPAGEWYDFWSGETHTGPSSVVCPAPLGRIPVFARAGSVVALNLDDTLALGGPVGNGVDRYHHLCFHAYPTQQPTQFEWFDDPRRAPTRFEIGPQAVVVSAVRSSYHLILPNSTLPIASGPGSTPMTFSTDRSQ